MNMTHNRIATDLFNLGHKVEFLNSWNNGTGYFDTLIDSSGEIDCYGHLSHSVDPNGRMILIIPARIISEGKSVKTSIVVFKRYADPERERIVVQAPTCLFEKTVTFEGCPYGGTLNVNAKNIFWKSQDEKFCEVRINNLSLDNLLEEDYPLGRFLTMLADRQYVVVPGELPVYITGVAA